MFYAKKPYIRAFQHRNAMDSEHLKEFLAYFVAETKNIAALMRQNNAKSYKTAAGSFTYVPPTTGKKFDSAKLKEDDPDLYDKYTKESTIAASLRIKLKK